MVELDGKFSNRAKGEDTADKAGTAFPDNEVYRGVCSNHICETCLTKKRQPGRKQSTTKKNT